MNTIIKWVLATIGAGFVMILNHEIATPVDFVILQVLVVVLLNQDKRLNT
jgi:hypothetical protein